MRKGLFVLLVCVIAVSGGMAMFRIGMTAIVDHPALEATREGIIDELILRGFALVPISSWNFNRLKGI